MSQGVETGGKLKSQISRKEWASKQRTEEEGHANLEYVKLYSFHACCVSHFVMYSCMSAGKRWFMMGKKERDLVL